MPSRARSQSTELTKLSMTRLPDDCLFLIRHAVRLSSATLKTGALKTFRRIGVLCPTKCVRRTKQSEDTVNVDFVDHVV